MSLRACMLGCFSCVLLLVTLWTKALQAPLSMGFSRQEYWSGLSCPPPGDLPNPGVESTSLTSPALTGRFFTTSAFWEAPRRVFRRLLRLNVIIKTGSISKLIHAGHIRKGRERDFCKHSEERPCEFKEENCKKEEFSSESQFHINFILDFQPQNCEKMHFCCLSHPFYDILFWQSDLTNTLIQNEISLHPPHTIYRIHFCLTLEHYIYFYSYLVTDTRIKFLDEKKYIWFCKPCVFYILHIHCNN